LLVNHVAPFAQVRDATAWTGRVTHPTNTLVARFLPTLLAKCVIGCAAADSSQISSSGVGRTMRREVPALKAKFPRMPARTVPTPRRRYVSVAEAAEYLGVSDRTIRAMIHDGRLTGYRNGAKLVRLDLDEIDAKMTPFGGGAQ
jgi:excisionase family DNA binding protein